MIRLDTTTRKLSAVLDAGTTGVHFTSCYSDKTTTTYTGATRVVLSNGATSVDIVQAPAASTIRDIDFVLARNTSGSTRTLTIRYDDSGTLYEIASAILAAGSSLSFTHGRGWQVIDASGQLLQTISMSVSAASKLLGRGDSGAGAVQEISLGAGLAMTGTTLASTGALAPDYVLLADEKTSGTAGGTFTAGSWLTREINTEASDTGSVCSLSSNRFTLTAGNYRIHAYAPGYIVGRHKIRLQNVTDSTTLLVGTSAYSGPPSNNDVTCSEITGRFTVAASKALEIQHYAEATSTTFGFGVPNSVLTERYTVVQLTREP